MAKKQDKKTQSVIFFLKYFVLMQEMPNFAF